MLRAYDALLGLPTLRRARRVVVITGNETAFLTARGVAASRIVEVPNGVPEDAFRPRDGHIAHQRWGLQRYVLFIGRLYHEKGPADLVEALGLLAAQHPDVGAVFLGPDQGEAPRLRARAEALGLAKRVVLAGTLPEEDKWDLLAGCEALALPSAWEAQGIVLQEAWAQGKPVVATRVGGVPFVVEHGRTGLLVPWADPRALAAALGELLADPERARRMGAAGRDVALMKYRWGPLAERLEGVYRAVEAEP
jgi:glycosyltransferase involved in cell wall biosynthesis